MDHENQKWLRENKRGIDFSVAVLVRIQYKMKQSFPHLQVKNKQFYKWEINKVIIPEKKQWIKSNCDFEIENGTAYFRFGVLFPSCFCW